MRIYLFLDSTALLVDDKTSIITIEPACSGSLEIEGRTFAVTTGTVFHPQDDLVGHVQVSFTPDGGKTHAGIYPYMAEGIPCSRVDYSSEYAKIRIRTDALERQVDRLAERYHKLSGEIKHNALAFLIKNTKNTEV